MRKGKKSRPAKKLPKRGKLKPSVTIPNIPSVGTDKDENVTAETTGHVVSPLPLLNETPMWQVVYGPKPHVPPAPAEGEDPTTKAFKKVLRDRRIDEPMGERKHTKARGLTLREIKGRPSLSQQEAADALVRSKRWIRKCVSDGKLTSTAKRRIKVDEKLLKFHGEVHGTTD